MVDVLICTVNGLTTCSLKSSRASLLQKIMGNPSRLVFK